MLNFKELMKKKNAFFFLILNNSSLHICKHIIISLFGILYINLVKDQQMFFVKEFFLYSFLYFGLFFPVTIESLNINC